NSDPTMIQIEAWIAEFVGDITSTAHLHRLLMELQPQQLKHTVNRARAEFRLGKKEITRTILDSIEASLLTDAIDLMEVAELYAFLNVPKQALTLAYWALRAGYSIPDIHLAYVTLFLRCSEQVEDLDPPAVGRNTAILVSSGSETHWITILDTFKPDPMH